MPLLLWVLYALTAAVALLVGLLFWKWHSQYPRVDTGYRLGMATQGEAQWEYANMVFGKVAVLVDVPAFLVAPALLSLLGAPFGWQLGVYFLLLVAGIGLALYLPQWLLRRRAP